MKREEEKELGEYGIEREGSGGKMEGFVLEEVLPAALCDGMHA